jgi:membrane-bound inhibitor of C-type lysozyme
MNQASRACVLALTVGVVGCAASPSTTPPAPVTYRCPSSRTVQAVYRPPTAATVRYEGRVYEMTVAVSGSGARYVGGGLEWWTRGTGPGSEGMILRHSSNGTPGDLVERCAYVSG